MSRFFGLLLTPLLFLPACDDSEPTVAEEADTFVDATVDYGVFFCECSVEADGGDPEACADAADDLFDGTVSECIEGVAETDASVREVLRCSTTALRELLDCYESAAICPDTAGSDSINDEDEDEDEDESFSDDACGRAFEVDLEGCGELPEEAGDALEACIPGDEAEAKSENCRGDEC